MTNIKKPRGTLDILPAETRAWRYAEDIIRREAAASGFEEIRFPTFESTELFDRGVGGTTDIVQKEMYTFTDRDGRSLSLRPEGTAGVARSVIENGLYAGAMPLKLYYLTNFFRYEKPQAGRSREFFQFGTELYGADGPEGDAEVIALADRVLRRLGLQSCALNLNSIGCADCRPAYRAALVDYFRAHESELCPTCRERLETNPLRILDCKSPICAGIAAGAPKTVDYLCGHCRDHFTQLQALLSGCGIAFTVNPRIVRGLDYYTGTVFEFISSGIGAQGTVCGGGRYDDLTGIFGMPDTSGVGISFGADRIYDVMVGLELFPEEVNFSTKVLFVNLGADEEAASLGLLRVLRDAGVAAEIYPEKGKMKKQMEYANRRSIPYVAIVGSDELARQTVTLKDMRTGEQRQVPFAELAASLQ